MKKILYPVLALILALALVSCGGGAPNTAAQTTAAAAETTKEATTAKATEAATTAAKAEEKTTEAAKTEAPKTEAKKTEAAVTELKTTQTTQKPAEGEFDPYAPYPETIIMTNCRVFDANPGYPPGDTVEDNIVTRYVKETLNIEYKCAWQVERSEFANKLALNIAAGDIPDVVPLIPQEYLVFRQLVENGLLADLTDIYDKYALPEHKKVCESYGMRNLEPFMFDGKLYGFGGGEYAYEHELLWIRKDWMDKCGITELPKTVEDIENLVLQFQEAKPEGKEVVGIPLHPKKPVDKYNTIWEASSLMYAYGGAPWTWVRDENGEIIWGSLLPGMKDGLAKLAEWYQKGIVDKQFITRDSNALGALVANSDAGVFMAPWWAPYVIDELPKNNPDADLVVTSAPLNKNGRYSHAMPGPSNDFFVVNAKYPYPEAPFKIIKAESDMNELIDPKTGKCYNQPFLDYNTGGYARSPVAYLRFVYIDGVPHGGKIAAFYVDGTPIPAKYADYEVGAYAVGTAERAKDWAETHVLNGSNWLDYMCRYIGSNECDNPLNEPVYPVYSFMSESMADYIPNLEKLEDEMYFKIIMGEKPIDYFDEFVQQWKAQGGDIVTQEVKRLVEK